MLPLDQRNIVDRNKAGKEEKFPALHPRWKQNLQFIRYQPPPLDITDVASQQEWMERMSFIAEDLHELLKLPHEQFWCQVIYDETLQRTVDSYLRNAPRSHDLVYYQLPQQLRMKQDEIHKLYFLVCLRMATHKESKENYLTPNIFGEIIYENFIFDVPKIMDLCILYGACNGPLLSKMVSNIFSNNPLYENDLKAVIPTVLQVFDNISQKCGVNMETGRVQTPQKLGTAKLGGLLALPITQLQDLIFYLHDTVLTLRSFLEIYPVATGVFMDAAFPLRIANFSESVFPLLEKALAEYDWGEAVHLSKALLKKLQQSQICLLKMFRHVVFECCLQPILECGGADKAGKVQNSVEKYVEIMTSVLIEKRFVGQLQSLFPFQDDQEILLQSAYQIDDTRMQFIQDGVMEAFSIHGRNRPQAGLDGGAAALPDIIPELEQSPRSAGAGAAASAECMQASRQYDDEEAGACAARKQGIELESLIYAVKDLLPDLGEGFIEICLEECNYQVEGVISAVLDDKLPSSLQDLDRTMPRRKPQLPPSEEVTNPEELLKERVNVFDGDEFDVFSRSDVDMSKVYMGKKNTTQEVSLGDKSLVKSLHAIYNKHGSEFVEEDGGEYDDEYDDTYDSSAIGADDADSADELTSRKYVGPRIFGISRDQTPDGGEDEDSSGTEDRRRDQFVEDPAKLREAAAQRRASRGAHMGRGRGGGEGQRTYDVQGKPKGQGQETDTTHNRAWKEKNKGTRVNHNRRMLADKKRKF